MHQFPRRCTNFVQTWRQSQSWQLDISDEDHDQTGFTLHHGLFRFPKCQFGLKKHALHISTNNESVIIANIMAIGLHVPDNITMPSFNTNEHLSIVYFLLSILHKADVTLKLKSYKFFIKKINYLGHVLRTGTWNLPAHRTDTILNLNPYIKHQLWNLPAACATYTRNLPQNSAGNPAPSNMYLKNGEQRTLHTLTREKRDTSGTIQDKKIPGLHMALPRTKRHLILDSASFDRQIGCILMQ